VITAVDTSVLLAIFKPETNADAWLTSLATAAASGPLVVCEIVYAELSAAFAQVDRLEQRLAELGIELLPSSKVSLFEAGLTFKRYRQAGGTRSNMVPDFLIGAHAAMQANQLASADRGYLRAHFAGLKLLAIE
jgi:predicted nucleic acid-binding protein